MKKWRPSPIEKFFRNEPDLLAMWNVLEIKEEKSVPFYAELYHKQKVESITEEDIKRIIPPISKNFICISVASKRIGFKACINHLLKH